ncbi:32529_t:CDS:2 [Gigaspora margarita]|uniref:32529_t:CDS:1 n=1 Tax=Gigaspora margarita TaxID=4874 RepID=A0ABN7V865_GIGMA|nr:32529_t:CDS:2 [Gigaspora margarita]
MRFGSDSSLKTQCFDEIFDTFFIPYPPRSKSKQIDGTTNNASRNPPERYPPKDGYENNRQFNVIVRAILMILEMKFIPFPPRPKSKQIDGTTNNASRNPLERYPPKDGYENNRQFNVIVRAILISNNLVKLWKKIGY